jgi:general stress protein 26
VQAGCLPHKLLDSSFRSTDAENFIIWFGTNPSSRKVQEIQANPHITVAIENTKEDANIVLYGFAEIEHDRQVRQKRWIES